MFTIKIGFQVLTILLLMYGVSAQSQPVKDSKAESEWSAGLRYGNGILLPHKEELYYLNNGRHQSVELNYEQRVNGSHRWHKIYAYPSFGFSAIFSHHGDSEKLGRSIALSTYARLPLWSISDRSRLNLRMAGGGIYVENPFDPVTNHRNLAIGTHINVFVQGMLEFSLRLDENWDASIGMQFNHFSNGSYVKPNKGINNAMISAGIYRVFNRGFTKPEVQDRYIPKTELAAMVSGSLRSPHINSNSQYGVGTLNLHFNRRFSRKFFATTGTDLMYNAANRRDLEIRNLTEASRSKNFQLGFFGGVGLRMGKTSLVITKGYTVISYDGPTAGIYHRFAFRQQIHPDFFYHIGILSNYFKANFLDFGIGYTINST